MMTPQELEDDAPLDPAATAALIAEQRSRVEEAVDVDARLLFGAWGTAWLLGFGTLWAVSLEDPLLPLDPVHGQIVFGCLLITAMVITAIHIARRSAGVRGASATQGAMYGWAWAITFAGFGAMGAALDRMDAGPAITATVMSGGSALAVGALYMAGGAIWRDWTQFLLGIWIGLVTVVAILVGFPHLLAVMALAGGGGMLAGGLVEAVRRR
jgi:hypothetical protein